MNARSHPTLRTRLLAGVAVVVAIGFALPAWASQLVTVRAGAHEKFTRVVFELDSSSGYRIENVGTQSAPALRVTLDAGSAIQKVRGHGDVRAVEVSAGPRAVATIRLRRSDLRVQEMILSNPHRIVLDLYRPASAVVQAPAPKPSPKPVAKTEPKPAPKPVAKTEPPVAPKPEPAPVAKTTPKPAPKVVAKSEPVEPPKAAEPPKPAPKPAAEPKPEPVPTPVVKATPEPAPKATPAPAPAIAPKPAPEAKQVARNELDESPLPMPTLEPAPGEKAAAGPEVRPTPAPPETADRTVPAMKITPPKPSPAKTETAKATPPAPTPAQPSLMDRVLGDPMWQGGIAAGVVALLAVVLLARRRYRALPNDLDVTAIAEEVEAADRLPEGGFAMDERPAEPASTAPAMSGPAATHDDSETSFAGLFDEPDAPATKPAAAMPASRPAVASETDSLFDGTGGLVGEDEVSEGEAPMNQDMDLPIDPNATKSPHVMGGAAAPSADVSHMLREFERRMAAMEARLDEANEAREKLERQVAAQSEELRVQRAAIARTQRALRTMSRADEDKATEPALRDGDTQAKTRVNV